MSSIFYTPNKQHKRTHSEITPVQAQYNSDKLYQTHRCRFIDFNPLQYTVVDIVYNHNNTICAVLRSNNTIELYAVQQKYYKYATIHNPTAEQYINKLCWYHNRLFCITSNSRLIEYNLSTLSIQHVTDTYSAAYSIDICTQYNNTDQQIIVVGCVDGAIRLYDVSDPLQPAIYLRTIQSHTVNTRINAVQFHSDNVSVLSATENGEIKIYNTQNNTTTCSITTASKYNKTNLSIHCAKFLNSTEIVVGNSNGHIQLYSTKFGTLTSEFIAHNADVMSMAVVPQHNTFYSCSIDNSVIEYKLINDVYVQTVSHKQHTHDVLCVAVAVHNNNTYDVISGGIDTMLLYQTVTQQSNSTSKHNKQNNNLFTAKPCTKMFPLPANNAISHAVHNEHVLLLSHNECKLQLYVLGSANNTDNTTVQRDRQVLQLHNNYKHVLDINAKIDCIVCCIISSNGQYVAACDTQSIKLYAITIDDSDVLHVTAKRIKCDKIAHTGANSIQFSTDNTQLIIGALNNKVYTYDIEHNTLTTLDTQLQYSIVTHITQSHNTQYTAIATADSELNNKISIYNNNKHYWTVPRHHSMLPTALTYTTDNTLIVTYSNNSILCYDMTDKCITEWSKTNQIPHRLLSQTDHILNITVHNNNILLQAHTYMCYIDLSQPLSLKSDDTKPNSTTYPNGRIITRYRPLLYATFINTSSMNTLVVVEIGWLNVLQQLPNPLQTKKYGT